MHMNARIRVRAALLALLSLVAFALILSLPAASSAIAARDYAATFRARQAELLECAQGARGEVALRFAVSGQGELTGGEVAAAEPSSMRAVGERVLARARTWRFDRSTSGGRRQVRLIFAEGRVTIRNEAIGSTSLH